LAVLGMGLPAAAAPNARAVKVIPTADPSLTTAKARPSAVEWLMSGDFMTHLDWHDWGAARTYAVGIYNVNLCNPCAAGHTKRMPGRLTLSTVRSCHAVRLYTVARATYFLHGKWRVAGALGQPADPCSM
jgi:hypothetical protein